jgi:glycosyltransferase involved in cell wall biosynthesis
VIVRPATESPKSRPRRALVYGDVNLNLIDGSAIWAAAVVEVFALAGCDVTLLLKTRVTTTRLVAPLAQMPNVHIVRPFEEGLANERGRGLLSPGQAARIMARLDEREAYDLVVVRGSRVLERLVENGMFTARIWAYLTDMPQAVTEVTPESTERLTKIAMASRLMLCQTEELRGFLESTVPRAVGKSVLFPPILPSMNTRPARELDPGRPLKLAYSGKFAPLWKTEAMTALPDRLAERGVAAELHMVGDKIQSNPNDPGYATRMEKALRTASGVVWHRGLPRQEAIDLVGSCDLGLSWRDRKLDASLELSTKVLEYGLVGLPVVLNRTPMHEALLGVDYPLFVERDSDVVDAIETATHPPTFQLAAQRCRTAAETFTRERAVERTVRLLDNVFPTARTLADRTRPLRVVVASHDLKFFSRILERFQSMSELEVRIDDWPALDQHDPERSLELNAWADVVICEWCGPNAVWYANHKRPGQRLLIRLHRFELYRPWPAQLPIDEVDKVICVSPSYADLTRQQTGWAADKVAVIPNWVDDVQLDRAKLPGARFHLGMIGVGESRKRFDMALDILEIVRGRDDRYMLFAKTKMPWEYPWIWRRAGEAEHAQAVLGRIQNTPRLRGAVVFDAFGPDVAHWLRGIGFIMSTSDDESFHLSPAEGMASRAVPVIRNWPGAETIFDPMWIRDDANEMADSILESVDAERWQAAGESARNEVVSRYSLELVTAAWTELLVRDPEG